MSIIPNISEKCKGAMLGTAIGDALGWPNEPRSKNTKKNIEINDSFVRWTRNNRNPRWHYEIINPGEYSDDTQITLSVARSLLTGDWESFFANKELPFWLNYERGGGGALLRAAKCYKKKGLPPWKANISKQYFNAGGNGATMRILPHVITFADCSNTGDLINDIIKDTLITHGHPRAFLGATCYGFLLYYLLKKDTLLEYGELVDAALNSTGLWGKFPDEQFFSDWLDAAYESCEYDFYHEWINTRDHMIEQLHMIKSSLGKGLVVKDKEVLTKLECFGAANGAGDVAILSAIYLASKYANNPVMGIKVPAFSFGADTDTIASITGGLVGMINGTFWIPLEWNLVQDYDCLINIVDMLLSRGHTEFLKENNHLSGSNLKDWRYTPIGKMELIETLEIPNGKMGYLLIKKWRSLLGQTIYTKEFEAITLNLKTNDEDSLLENKRSAKTVGEVFMLKINDIDDLLKDSKFKKKITFGKVLRIISCLLTESKTHESIAIEFNVDISFINKISNYIAKN